MGWFIILLIRFVKTLKETRFCQNGLKCWRQKLPNPELLPFNGNFPCEPDSARLC